MTTPQRRQPLATLECVVLDCPDPGELAELYCSLLGGSINHPDPRWAVGDGWATLHTPTGPVMAFQAVDRYVAPRWPDPAHPQQFHLDFHVQELGRTHSTVLAFGRSAAGISARLAGLCRPRGSSVLPRRQLTHGHHAQNEAA